jgi:hypothetical protein
VRMSSRTAHAQHSRHSTAGTAQHLVRMSSSTEPPSAATTLLRCRLGIATCS